MLDTAHSLYLGARVEPTGGCIQNPNTFRLLYFQPTGMTGVTHHQIGTYVDRGNLNQAAIWYGTIGSTLRRIPPGKANYYFAGTPTGWPVKPEVLHVPPEVYYNPDPVSFNLYVYAQGHSGDPKDKPVDLGETIITFGDHDLKTSLDPQTQAASRQELRNEVSEASS